MKNVIQLIERIGSSSDLSAENYEDIIEQSEVSDELKQALLNKDSDELERLLGANHNLMCVLVPADDDDGDGDDGDGDSQEESRLVHVAGA